MSILTRLAPPRRRRKTDSTPRGGGLRAIVLWFPLFAALVGEAPREAGLAPIDDRRKPLLFLGCALSAFLDARRVKRKRPLRPGQIYCVACHDAKEPALGMVEYVPLTATSGDLRPLSDLRAVNLPTRLALQTELNSRLFGGHGYRGATHKGPDRPLRKQ